MGSTNPYSFLSCAYCACKSVSISAFYEESNIWVLVCKESVTRYLIRHKDSRGLGIYGLSDEVCYSSVTTLLNAGGRLIDTAHIYQTEESVGRAVRDSAIPREDIFVITKLYPNQFDDAESAIDEEFE